MTALPPPSPFHVLGMAPSTDLALVKKAYFSALAKHPPHADADGFKRVREAYESLLKPGGLAAAYASAPLDLAAELRAYDERWEPRIRKVAADEAAAQTQGRSSERVASVLSRMALRDAVARWGRSGG